MGQTYVQGKLGIGEASYHFDIQDFSSLLEEVKLKQEHITQLQSVFNTKPSLDRYRDIWEKIGPINVKEWADDKKFDLDTNLKIIDTPVNMEEMGGATCVG